jgi:hypothetical protein
MNCQIALSLYQIKAYKVGSELLKYPRNRDGECGKKYESCRLVAYFFGNARVSASYLPLTLAAPHKAVTMLTEAARVGFADTSVHLECGNAVPHFHSKGHKPALRYAVYKPACINCIAAVAICTFSCHQSTFTFMRKPCLNVANCSFTK